MKSLRSISLVLPLLLFGAPASADLPPAIPDYLFALPEGEWVFGEKLWEGPAGCQPDLCEAGYHSGDLVLSIVRGLNYVQAVAGMRGCGGVSYNVVNLDEWSGISSEQWLANVSRMARSLAAIARQGCNAPGSSETIDTAPLRYLQPGAVGPAPSG